MSSHDGYIEFNTDDIAHIAQATQGHQQDWDRIWEEVKSKLSHTVSEALDALTGSSLEDRSRQYHQKTVQYTGQLQSQTHAVRNVGDIATDTNHQMSRVIAG